MKVDIDVPDGVSGNCRVETFTVDGDDFLQKISMMKYGRGVPSGTYKRLYVDGSLMMSNTPNEIADFIRFVFLAKGSVLINGLGLGVVVKALLKKPEITDITVIEKSEDVIKLVAPTYLKDSRVSIIHADAFEYRPPKGKRYDAVWHDIWVNICSDNLPEMHRLHRKYGRKCDYQDSWCRGMCEEQKRKSRRYYY